jgi:hypothetical protein
MEAQTLTIQNETTPADSKLDSESLRQLCLDTGADDVGIWVVSHKPVAVAAGLGRMGIHRNVIHPRFGNFILLGTILIDAEVSRYDHPIDYNPVQGGLLHGGLPRRGRCYLTVSSRP